MTDKDTELDCPQCIHWKKWRNNEGKILQWCAKYTEPDVFQYCPYFQRSLKHNTTIKPQKEQSHG